MKIYGIKNCDTVKKALKFCDANHMEYTFHDIKKSPVESDNITAWLKIIGWETLINKRGTTWRQLDDATKQTMTAEKALSCILQNQSIMKRPIIVYNDDSVTVGFNADVQNKMQSCTP